VAVPGLEIDDHTNSQGQVTLRLSGELDANSVSVLEQAAERQFEVGVSALTLDLSELMFIDSTGLAAVVLVSRLCERDKRALEIVPGPRSVQRLFEITGLVDVLPFQDAPRPLG
jgi:anti-sigma B factor antagonist